MSINDKIRSNLEESVIQAYINNTRKVDIAKYYKISRPTVDKILRTNNVTPEDKNAKPQKEIKYKKSYYIRKERKPKVRVTPQRELDIVRLYNEGASVINLSQEYGLSRERIYQYLRATGFKKEKSKYNKITMEIANYYADNKITRKETCYKFNISPPTFHRFLAKNKITKNKL
ncbi:hypothetical protein SOX05_08570 [Pseudomonas putida]|nr:hypothetical protein [Pseudomonas putida]MDY4319314.1 hypothetical protein [Pseudomonas putida]MDY4352699.1 hypothetical protein [Pseudomonas putida]